MLMQALLIAGNLYCQYNSATLQLMTSTLFIAGAICELSGTTGALLECLPMLAFWPEPGQEMWPPCGKQRKRLPAFACHECQQ